MPDVPNTMYFCCLLDPKCRILKAFSTLLNLETRLLIVSARSSMHSPRFGSGVWSSEYIHNFVDPRYGSLSEFTIVWIRDARCVMHSLLLAEVAVFDAQTAEYLLLKLRGTVSLTGYVQIQRVDASSDLAQAVVTLNA